jgi:hypothetical protein
MMARKILRKPGLAIHDCDSPWLTRLWPLWLKISKRVSIFKVDERAENAVEKAAGMSLSDNSLCEKLCVSGGKLDTVQTAARHATFSDS